MTAEERHRLLTTPSAMLTELQKQDRFLLSQAIRPARCFHTDCGAMSNQLEACDQGPDGFDPGGRIKNTFTCPKCKRPMQVGLLFFGGIWIWEKKEARP